MKKNRHEAILSLIAQQDIGTQEELMQMLNNHGLDILFKTADFTLLPPDDKSQRIHYIVRKRENNE